MRVFFIFFLLLVSQSVFGQRKVYLWGTNLKDNTFEQGDSAWIRVKFDNDFTKNDTLNFTIWYDGVWDWQDTVFKMPMIDVLSIPMEADQTTILKFKIPEFALIGGARLGVRFGQFDLIPFTITQNTTSITNPLIEKNIKVFYYDILGNTIEKPTEGLYIWISETGETGKIFIKN